MKKSKATVWMAHGGYSLDARQEILDEYMGVFDENTGGYKQNPHPGPCVLVATHQAFGTSINLHDTDAAFFVMLPYTPEALRQSEGRFVRNGMKRSVIIYYVIAEDTVDERIASILLEKLPAVEEIANDQELGEVRLPLSGIDPNESEEEFVSAILADMDF